MAAPGELTAKQQRFVKEYLVDCNATAAATRAGYSARSAKAIGAENLTKPAVQAAIRAGMAERARRVDPDTTPEVRADRVLRELMALAYRDLRDILETLPDGGLRVRPVSAWPEAVGRAIDGIKIRQEVEKRPDGTFAPLEVLEFKLSSKVAALHDLATHLGLLKHVVEHSGEVRVVIDDGWYGNDAHRKAAQAAAAPVAGPPAPGPV